MIYNANQDVIIFFMKLEKSSAKYEKSAEVLIVL